MENIEYCPVCSENRFKAFIKCKDHSISKEVFEITRCENCNFLFTNPRPNEFEIGKYYDSNVYISHHADKSGFIPWIYRIIRDRQFVNKTNIIKSHFGHKVSVLDIGCGTGDFLKYCSGLGWETAGVEPDEDARKKTNTKQIVVHDTDYLNSTNDKFDVITMWHVLEHIHTLDARLNQLNRLQKENSIVIVAVPNPNSYDAGHYQEYWAAYDLPRHLYHFTKNSITHLFSNHGLKLTNTIPMKYDAYYVSIKSEEYKNKNSFLNLIKGIIFGFISNFKASSNSEYSSLIYVFEN